MNRFDNLSRNAARLLLAALVVLISYGLVAPPAPANRVKDPTDTLHIDQNLYSTVATRVQRGEDYYRVAAAEHRMRGYPLQPFVTVRPPALARATAAIGDSSRVLVLLQALAVLATIAITIRTFAQTHSRNLTLAVAAMASLAVSGASNLFQMHEAWAGMLILIALAVHSSRSWWLTAVLLFVAVLIRELAAPVLLVMLAGAVAERRWREAGVWVITLAVFSATLVVHAQHVAAVVLPTDRRSPGWTAAGGWPFILRMLNDASVFFLVPLRACAVLVPLSLLGWASWRHPIAARATVYLGGMLCAFMVIGRSNNNYWALLLAPVLPIGLAFAPGALLALSRAAFARPSATAV